MQVLRTARGTDEYDEVLLIASDVRQVRVPYWGRQGRSAPAAWSEEWTSPNRLPLLVRLDWENAFGEAQVPILLEPGRATRREHRHLEDLVLE